MSSFNWRQSWPVLLFSTLVFPPAGLVLLWARAGTGAFRKLAGSLPIVVLGIAHLFWFYGLRVEFDGGVTRPIFSFYKPASHYSNLERDRARQRELASVAQAASTEQNPVPAGNAPGPSPAGAPPASAGSVTPAAGMWTDFRGPHRDGHYDESPIRTDWPAAGLPLLWKQPVGGGYASFVVAQGKAFTIEQRRGNEVVAAYDVASGRELWTNSWPAEFRESMGGDGPRATPTWHEGRLYALGATGEFRCLDAETGKLHWSHNILTDSRAQNLPWGMAASPLIADDKVIVLPGGDSGKSVVAYHKVTGEKVWSVLDDPQAYTSPMLVTLAGQRQLLIVSGRRVMGLTVENGTLLWEVPWVTEYGINTAQPVLLGENRFFISASYDHGGATVEISREGAGFKPRVVWQNMNMKNKFTTSVLHDGYLYGLDEAILACVDAATGERKWKGGRYGYGQVLLAGDHLVVLTESGEVVLVKATPAGHQELARFSALDGKSWNVPAIAGGRLLVRNATQMAAFQISP